MATSRGIVAHSAYDMFFFVLVPTFWLIKLVFASVFSVGLTFIVHHKTFTDHSLLSHFPVKYLNKLIGQRSFFSFFNISHSDETFNRGLVSICYKLLSRM